VISVIILDPASLTLHFDSAIITQRDGGEAIIATFEPAYAGRIDELAALLNVIGDAALKSRCAHFATCVWHEKRHFLDFLLTNYGALRVAQFFQLYGNMERLLAEALQNKHALWFPLDIFLSPIHRRILGIETPWPFVQTIAENMRGIRELVAEDRHPVGAGSKLFEVGGDAQLEALAWICQLAAAEELLGTDASFSAQGDMALFSANQRRYRWIVEFAAGLGILPHRASQGVWMQDVSFVMPLLYAALQIRAYGQTKTVPKSEYSSLPSQRLYALAMHIRQRGSEFRPAGVEESWDQVNTMCREIWGRTALEEMKHNLVMEEQLLQDLQGTDSAPDEVKACFADYHRLRALLIEMLEQSPSSVLDPVFFARNTLPRLQPYVIACRPDGVLGKVPSTLELIHGFYDGAQQNDNGWWWAASPTHLPASDENIIRLECRNEWLSLTSHLAPIAKLMMNGRAHRTMIGPELLSAEMRLRHTGFQIGLDPALAFPREDPTAQMESYYILRESDTAVCDCCRKTIRKPEGRFLSPWLFRHNTAIGNLAITALTPEDGNEDAGRRRFWRDWSPWVCCDECFSAMIGNPGFKAGFEATAA
jgi:hypothetical protein